MQATLASASHMYHIGSIVEKGAIMKKLFLLFVIAISAVSSISYASSSADCPLKNLKKNQRREADGTAYYPPGLSTPQSGQSSGSVVSRNQ